MFSSQSKLFLSAAFISLLIFAIPFRASAQAASQSTSSENSSRDTSAQTAPDPTSHVPQPGELGSAFPVDHFWKHVALELSGGYCPVVQKGGGYLNKGFNVTPGVIDHLSPRWTLLGEIQIFGLNGSVPVDTGSGNFTLNYSNVTVGFGVATEFDILPRARTSPYVIGGAGYYLLGPATLSGTAGADLTDLNAASSAGFNGGLGIRRQLYSGRRTELFAEGRYQYIASGSTDFGQISLLPISAGIRW